MKRILIAMAILFGLSTMSFAECKVIPDLTENQKAEVYKDVDFAKLRSINAVEPGSNIVIIVLGPDTTGDGVRDGKVYFLKDNCVIAVYNASDVGVSRVLFEAGVVRHV